jgi:Protein of unknown function (DUF1360)
MVTERRGTYLQDAAPACGDAPRERPLGGYAVLTSTFTALVVAFSAWIRASDRELPEHLAPGDLALLTVATHKTSRLIAKDRVTSTVRAPFTRFQSDAGAGEVQEQARGHGLRRAIGELLVCPYCLGLWIGAIFTAALIVAPRATRWTASVLAVLFGSDALQMLHRRLQDRSDALSQQNSVRLQTEELMNVGDYG